MESQSKYFYCYSPKLRRFITENGMTWMDRGFNEKSKSPFWIFVNNDKLSEIIKKYKSK